MERQRLRLTKKRNEVQRHGIGLLKEKEAAGKKVWTKEAVWRPGWKGLSSERLWPDSLDEERLRPRLGQFHTFEPQAISRHPTGCRWLPQRQQVAIAAVSTLQTVFSCFFF